MSDSVQPHRQQSTRLPRPWDSPGKNTGVGCHFLLQCMKAKSESEVPQSHPTLRDPMDCSPPGSSIHGIFQARVLEWGAIAFSRIRVQERKLDIMVENNISREYSEECSKIEEMIPQMKTLLGTKHKTNPHLDTLERNHKYQRLKESCEA